MNDYTWRKFYFNIIRYQYIWSVLTKLFCKMTEIILAKAKREIQGGNNQRPAILFWKSNYSLSVLICFYEMLSNVKFRTCHKINPTRLTNKGLIASAVFLSQILNWCNKLLWPNFSKKVPFAFSLQLHPKILCFQRQKGKEKIMGLRRYLPLLNKLLLWVDWRNNHNLWFVLLFNKQLPTVHLESPR